MKKKFTTPVSIVAFLDVIACGFGAIVLLVLILPVGEYEAKGDSEVYQKIGEMRNQVKSLNSGNSLLELDFVSMRAALSVLVTSQDSASRKEGAADTSIAVLKKELLLVSAAADSLELELKQKLLDTGVENEGPPSRSYGIPVDSDYLVFVIDTSGSMKKIWPRVMSKVLEILRNYPRLKGFQILSDQGEILYAGKQNWLPADKRSFDAVQAKLSNWNAYSNSSPVEGIRVAIDRLYRPGLKIGLFVAGDDYTGNDFDSFLAEIESIRQKAGASAQLRIHALGFFNEAFSQYPERFSRLMQILTFDHGGAFLYIGNQTPQQLTISRGRPTPASD